MNRIYDIWHAFCRSNNTLRKMSVRASLSMMLFISHGCYYWRPLEVYTPNYPPEILYSDPSNGTNVQFRTSQTNSAFVVVQDLDDSDTLQFQWYISGAILLGPGESFSQGDFIGSKITIVNAEESWHGRTLTCVVIDGSNETATISWPIEILEEN